MARIYPGKRFIVQILALTAWCGAAAPSHAETAGKTVAKGQVGVASWHAPTGRGCRTASRRRWVNSELVAAHRSLPMGTTVRVVNLSNGHEVVVRITDRGPYCHGRIIDVSRSAAQQLGLVQRGTARVRVETLTPEASKPHPVLVAFRDGPLLD